VGGDREDRFTCELGAEEAKKVLHLCRADNRDSALGGDTACNFREAVAHQVESSSHRARDVQSALESRV
jgi:hypothetical protein